MVRWYGCSQERDRRRQDLRGYETLNENVLREIYPIPKVEDTLTQLAGATTFSKIDANSGFWQIPLEVESRLLTTFVTPHGRYCFNKLPFGIASSPELFQRRMSKILSGQPGVLCHMDDVLIFGTSQTEHDDRLTSVLQRLQAAGETLNKAKCEFGVHTVKFLGHIIDGKGLRADPARLKAIQDLEQPKNVSELRRFMGMAKPIGKSFTTSFRDKSTFERAVEYEMLIVMGTFTRASIHKNQR